MSKINHWVKCAHQVLDNGLLRLLAMVLALSAAGLLIWEPMIFAQAIGGFGPVISPADMGNMYCNDLRCWLCTTSLVLAGVLHPVSRIADFVLYHVVAFVLIIATVEYETDKITV